VSLQTRTILLGFALALATGGPGSSSAATEPWPPEPKPTAQYASLEAARDSIGAMVRRCVSHADTAVHVSREAVTFEYLYAKATARGWAFHVAVNDTSSCPDESVQKALTDAGWVESFGYSADGPDGSNMGYLCRNFFCLVEGTWDGGDDSDQTYVPEPGCKVTVTCVPRREDDIPPQ
jgi:hypothetical protein